MNDRTAAKLKKAGIPPLVRKGDWQLHKEARLGEQKHVPGLKSKTKKEPAWLKVLRGGKVKSSELATIAKHKRKRRKDNRLTLAPDTQLEMARDKAGGMTNSELAQKYAISEDYVRESLNRLYVNNEQGREILKSVVLENAIASGMHARSKVGELNAMQATVATGIMTSRFVELDKHTRDVPKVVDFSELAKVGQVLTQLHSEVAELMDGSTTIEMESDQASE